MKHVFYFNFEIPCLIQQSVQTIRCSVMWNEPNNARFDPILTFIEVCSPTNTSGVPQIEKHCRIMCAVLFYISTFMRLEMVTILI